MLISLTTFLAIVLDLPFACCPSTREPGAAPPNRRASEYTAKRPKLTPVDRLLWICLSRLWRDWRSALAIVKPETVIAWHRARLSNLLDVEGAALPTRTTRPFARGPRSDPPDVPVISRCPTKPGCRAGLNIARLVKGLGAIPVHI